jgi:hypothetical protein
MGVDEPQMVQTIVSFIGAGLGAFFFLCFFAGLVDERVKPLSYKGENLDVDDQDLFAIATGDEEYLAAHVSLTPSRKAPRKAQKKRQPKRAVSSQTTKKAPQMDSGLLTDCVGALVSLGTKSGEARKTATKCLKANPSIKTPESFLTEVFKNAT